MLLKLHRLAVLWHLQHPIGCQGIPHDLGSAVAGSSNPLCRAALESGELDCDPQNALHKWVKMVQTCQRMTRKYMKLPLEAKKRIHLASSSWKDSASCLMFLILWALSEIQWLKVAANWVGRTKNAL